MSMDNLVNMYCFCCCFLVCVSVSLYMPGHVYMYEHDCLMYVHMCIYCVCMYFMTMYSTVRTQLVLNCAT